MRIIFFLLLLLFADMASAQFSIPAYNVVKDSATHITVFHSGNVEKIRLSQRHYSDTLSIISPDIRIKNGIVEHKGLTGDMLVREYYIDSVMIGYVEFDGRDMQRELYFNSGGNTFLEKRYEQGLLIYTNDKVRTITFR